jgi:hypothetical protein
MTNEKFGIEGIKKVLDYAFGLTQAIKVSLEDGEITLSDFGNFIKTVSNSASTFAAVKLLKDEVEDLSMEEETLVLNYTREKFPTFNDTQIKEVTIAGLNFAMAAAILIREVKELKD